MQSQLARYTATSLRKDSLEGLGLNKLRLPARPIRFSRSAKTQDRKSLDYLPLAGYRLIGTCDAMANTRFFLRLEYCSRVPVSPRRKVRIPERRRSIRSILGPKDKVRRALTPRRARRVQSPAVQPVQFQMQAQQVQPSGFLIPARHRRSHRPPSKCRTRLPRQLTPKRPPRAQRSVFPIRVSPLLARRPMAL